MKKSYLELTETAILGTDRKPLAIQPREGELGATIADIAASEASPDRKLLDQLTAVSIASKAGMLPVKFSAGLDSMNISKCAPETKERVSERSLAMLVQVLNLEAKGSELRLSKIIEEWLSFCVRANQRVPEEFITRLLELGKNWPFKHLLEKAGGERFYWLLSLNKDWRGAYSHPDYSNVENLIELFETGSNSERATALRAIREHHTQATSAVLTGFEKESIENKTAILKMLGINLGTGDEAFLEEIALKDRRKEIRNMAAAHLILIPDSRLQKRMIARVDQYVNYKIGFLQKGKFVVTLPEALKDDDIADGVQETLTIDSRLGQKATWLCQMLSLVPPQHLRERFSITSTDMLKAALDHPDWSLLLTLAFMASAARFGDKDMMQAIIACRDIHLTDSQAGLVLLKALPENLLENLVLTRLPSWSQERNSAAPRLDIWYYLEQVDFNWSARFSQDILKFIIKESREKVPVFGHTFYSNAATFALRMHVSAGTMLEQVDLTADQTDIYRRNALERMVDTLRMRYEIYQSFSLETKEENTDGKR